MTEEVRQRASVKEGDFYSFSEQPFDIGFDYTVRHISLASPAEYNHHDQLYKPLCIHTPVVTTPNPPRLLHCGLKFCPLTPLQFLCAMHPNQRRDWAATWAKLIQPGGILATLIFPVDPSRDPDVGPPFPLTPDLYRQLLPPAGFEEISVEPIPEQLSHTGRGGFEHMGIWRRAEKS